MNTGSRYSKVGIATRLRAAQSRNRGSIPNRGYIPASRPALGRNNPPIPYAAGGGGGGRV